MSYAPLNLTGTATPSSQEDLATLVQQAHADGTPLYPIGGAVSMEFGLAPKRPGVGVLLSSLQRVVDFPARDLTITVEAGISMQALAQLLATEGLQLPVDVPHPERATLGGVIATAWSGPRRYGHGSIRDFVIGIRAVDGRGIVFNGGGRVVKNVAGYDFCKLLTGSLGTLGILTQVTLKLRPLAQQTTLIRVALPSLAQSVTLLDALASSAATPTAIELRYQHQQVELAILLEGTAPEVAWMQSQLLSLLEQQGAAGQVMGETEATSIWKSLVCPVAIDAPLALKASVRPSELTRLMQGVLEIDPDATLQAHAGNGIVYVSFSTFPKDGLSRTVISRLQPLAASLGGHVIVISNPSGQEATPQSTWGTLGAQHTLMTAVKEQFDPRNILNPGRYVFP